jgi:hypothetical protein
MANAWLTHLKAFYAAHKKSGMTYSAAMKAAKATYKKGSKEPVKKKTTKKRKK